MAVVGAGAAGLMAAIHAARRGQGGPVVALDGARTLGAKILVSGGGRCNVTHHAVHDAAFAGPRYARSCGGSTWPARWSSSRTWASR